LQGCPASETLLISASCSLKSFLFVVQDPLGLFAPIIKIPLNILNLVIKGDMWHVVLAWLNNVGTFVRIDNAKDFAKRDAVIKAVLSKMFSVFVEFSLFLCCQR